MGTVSNPVIVNRPLLAAERFAARLRSGGVTASDLIVSPVIAISQKGGAIDLGKYTGVIFTSANAVDAFAKARIPAKMKAFCVGEQTGQAASNAGFESMVAAGSAEALCRMVQETGLQGPLLFARGDSVAVDVSEVLSQSGISVSEHVVYAQEARTLNFDALTALETRQCIVPLFSARTAQRFGDEAAGMPNPGHVIVGISDNVSRAFPLDWQRVTANFPDADGMFEAVVRVWNSGARRLD